MTMPRYACLSSFLLILLLTGSATAGVFEDAVAAFHKGDSATAMRLWRQAAGQGDPRAQHELGNIYWQRHDYSESVKWLRLAADQGNTGAQWDLGVMYESGSGVPRDYVTAYMWLNLSAAHETNSSVRTLVAQERDIIAKGMTREQIAEAQKMSREWKPGPPPEQ